jgi:HK97 family phage prohead protease
MTMPLTRGELEHKAVRLEVKFLPQEGEGVFEGYASTFGNEDQGADIVARGAFAKSLQERGSNGVKMLYEHDPCQPIGRWLSLSEDSQGLLGKGKLSLGVSKSRDVYELLKDRVLDSLSIGYRVVDSTTERGNAAVRVLKAVDLREISVVAFPMNEKAVIQAVKSTDLPSDIAFLREFERRLVSESQLSRSKVGDVVALYKSLIKALSESGGEQVADAVCVKQPDVAWQVPFVDELRRLTDVARS